MTHTKHAWKALLLGAALLTGHLFLLANLAISWSPNTDETAHIAGGLRIWECGDFDLYCVNPPLTRALAALPAYLIGTTEGWCESSSKIQTRPEFTCNTQLVASHPDRWRTFLCSGRLLILSFSIVGALVCFQWSRRLYGLPSALIALCLWCFCPNILTWSAVICSDGVATSLGLAASYCFWRWLRRPHWGTVLIAGSTLGLAELSKMTWIILFPLWIALWCVCHASYPTGVKARKQVLQLISILLLGLYILNLGYAFEGCCMQLKDYCFFSRTLTATDPAENRKGDGGNRFADSVLGFLPVPLPKSYVRGIDLQKADLEAPQDSYLLGEWRPHGWWYYYLIGLILKTPTGALGLALAALLALATRHSDATCIANQPRSSRQSLADHVVLLTPALSVLLLVSSHDEWDCNFRYVLPALPFAYVFVSRVGQLLSRQRPFRSLGILALLCWCSYSSLRVYPHSISYFNEIAGGPENGHKHMLGSSFSWSQDLFYLKDWCDAHLGGERPFVSVNTHLAPEFLGIASRGVSPMFGNDQDRAEGDLRGPVPGWHAVETSWMCNPLHDYSYSREFQPVARVGYSINIYHICLDEANRVRERLGLAPLEAESSSSEHFINVLADAASKRKTLKVAVYCLDPKGDALGLTDPLRTALEILPELTWKAVDTAAIVQGQLKDFDVILFPGGIARTQADSLGEDGKRKVREFVRNGGGYLGICAGAFLGSSTFDWGLRLVNCQSRMDACYSPRNGNQSWINRGYGEVNLTLTDVGQRLFAGSASGYRTSFSGGPVFEPGRHTYLPDYVCLASYSTEVSQFDFQKGTMRGTPAMIAAPYGMGKVIIIGCHLEATPELQSFIGTAIRALGNQRDAQSLKH